MDSSHYPDSGARNDALCRATARDRGHFAKNAHPDTAKPRARWLGTAHRSSRCASEGGVLSHEIGPDFDRAVARALPLVGKTSRGASSESRAGKASRSGVMEYWGAGIVKFHHSITRLPHLSGS